MSGSGSGSGKRPVLRGSVGTDERGRGGTSESARSLAAMQLTEQEAAEWMARGLCRTWPESQGGADTWYPSSGEGHRQTGVAQAGRRLDHLAELAEKGEEAQVPRYRGKRDQDYGLARAVCEQCPVKQTCLQWALDHNEDHGMWGAMTPPEREALRKRGGTASEWFHLVGRKRVVKADTRADGTPGDGSHLSPFCSKGHPYSETNTRLVKSSKRGKVITYRECIICERARQRRRKYREAAQRKAASLAKAGAGASDVSSG